MVVQARDLREAPLDELESVARDALARRFGQIIEDAGDDTLYFVALLVSNMRVHPVIAANTEETLERREGTVYARQGVTDFEIDPWDPGQWRWIEDCPAIDTIANTLVAQHDAWEEAHPDEDTWEAIQDRMDDLYMGILEDLDREGVFGRGRRAGDTALLYMDEDEFDVDDWRNMFRRLNPSNIEERLVAAWRLDKA